MPDSQEELDDHFPAAVQNDGRITMFHQFSGQQFKDGGLSDPDNNSWEDHNRYDTEPEPDE